MAATKNTPTANAQDVTAKHTPGPWNMVDEDKRIAIGVGLVEGPNGYDVAEVYNDDCPREVGEANARLIAAAPDLLEALQEVCRPYGMLDIVVSEHMHGSRGDDMLAVAKKVRAALAKVTAAATCPRCDGHGVINVEDRPYPNDISPSTHEAPCPECSA